MVSILTPPPIVEWPLAAFVKLWASSSAWFCMAIIYSTTASLIYAYVWTIALGFEQHPVGRKVIGQRLLFVTLA